VESFNSMKSRQIRGAHATIRHRTVAKNSTILIFKTGSYFLERRIARSKEKSAKKNLFNKETEATIFGPTNSTVGVRPASWKGVARREGT